MLQTIAAAMFVTAVIVTKPALRVIKRISEKREEKELKEKLMIEYLERDFIDIEH